MKPSDFFTAVSSVMTRKRGTMFQQELDLTHAHYLNHKWVMVITGHLGLA